MKRCGFLAIFASVAVGPLIASPCVTAPLTTYLSGSPFTCTENGALPDSVTISFQHDLLPSYVGLSILGGSSALPGNITVVPDSPGISFEGDFSTSGVALSSQAELVHFLMTSQTAILGTTFSLQGALVSAGAIGAGLVIGQELVCVGGTFTSLPVGLITSVSNGVLGVGDQFGCNGTALIGTAAVSAGNLGLFGLSLPSLIGVTDQAAIQFTPTDQTTVDVIKLQALLSVANGSARTTGFGNTFDVADVPEPGSAVLFALGGCLLLGLLSLKRRSARRVDIVMIGGATANIKWQENRGPTSKR